jgi:hypothetical protein
VEHITGITLFEAALSENKGIDKKKPCFDLKTRLLTCRFGFILIKYIKSIEFVDKSSDFYFGLQVLFEIIYME